MLPLFHNGTHVLLAGDHFVTQFALSLVVSFTDLLLFDNNGAIIIITFVQCIFDAIFVGITTKTEAI